LTDNGLHNEQELLQQIAGGNETAFKQIVDVYWTKVYGQALAYCKSSPQAEELTQDTFIAIWINRQKLPEVTNFAGYLYTIARHKLLNTIRQKLATTTTVDNIPLEETNWRPDVQMEYRQAYDQLMQGMEALPPVRKKVFMMSRLEGKSYDEIATELQVSRNTVKEHIVKALNFLRSHVATHHDCFFPGVLLLIFLRD
jgi:RNA polymerase sigma-70 factor (family 1)